MGVANFALRKGSTSPKRADGGSMVRPAIRPDSFSISIRTLFFMIRR